MYKVKITYHLKLAVSTTERYICAFATLSIPAYSVLFKMPLLLQLILLLCVLSLVFGGSIVEPQTKHSFSDNDSGLALAGVGVRVKQIGPIKAKVYAGIKPIYFL